MNKPITETHPLEPFVPEGANVLMLGSFPPKRIRWSMDFYYPNLQNDMWRIFGIVFFGDRDHFMLPEEKRFDRSAIEAFLREKGVALSDTAREVIRHRDNASDQFLEVVREVDLAALLESMPRCTAIVTTGGKATDTLRRITGAQEPRVGTFREFTFEGCTIRHYRMPSSSRAYPKPIAEKAAMYRAMFEELGMV